MSQLDHWSASRGHESSDVIARTAPMWALGLAIFVAVGIVLSLLTYWLASPRPFAGPQPQVDRVIPTEQPLQDNLTAQSDIAALRRKENTILSTSGPSDYHPGGRRIPIESAIDELAARGLPGHPFKPGSYQLAPSAAEAPR